MSPITLEQFGAALAALSALATAAFGLLDSSKAFWGGVSNVGLRHIERALAPFKIALDAAMGQSAWWLLVRANWMNGMAKDQQKAVVRGMIKLGLNIDTAASLADATRVDATALKAIAAKLAKGQDLTDTELNVLGRLNAVLDAKLDVGFEQAEQQYRNVSRVLAGVVCILLALIARGFWPGPDKPGWWVAIAVGLLAVPVAPVAKDLTSAVSAAMKAIKLGKA
jgi:hypothetical protein